VAEITKKIILFLISLVLIILYLVSATTSYAEVTYEYEMTEKHLRFYTINWIVEKDDSGSPFVCGTKVSTFDMSGRKFIIEYYYLLKDNNTIVTRFDVSAIQMSVMDPDSHELDVYDIKLYGTIIRKDDKNILAGVRSAGSTYRGVGAEYYEFDREGNTKLFKTLYKGRYELEIYTIPGVSFKVPIRVNLQYRKEHEYKIDDCIAQLILRHKKEKDSGVYINEDFAHRVG
jgi:hypothetical protein